MDDTLAIRPAKLADAVATRDLTRAAYTKEPSKKATIG
jgi:hypothetical protein